jgi:hypothetical protein
MSNSFSLGLPKRKSHFVMTRVNTTKEHQKTATQKQDFDLEHRFDNLKHWQLVEMICQRTQDECGILVCRTIIRLYNKLRTQTRDVLLDLLSTPIEDFIADSIYNKLNHRIEQ